LWNILNREDKTWPKKIIIIIISISIAYGLWFDYLDSIPTAGKIFGGNLIYQPWNIIGHLIPGLFLLLTLPDKFEIFIAAFLISTVVMDSPMWGIERIYMHHGVLWNQTTNTSDMANWILFYYNPLGTYGVWDGTFPTASVMFVSLAARLAVAIFLITYQSKIESEINRQVNLKQLIKRDYR
jgi:hypothetical protein